MFTSYIYLSYVYESLSACMDVYHMHAQCMWRSEQDVRMLSTKPRSVIVKDSFNH